MMNETRTFLDLNYKSLCVRRKTDKIRFANQNPLPHLRTSCPRKKTPSAPANEQFANQNPRSHLQTSRLKRFANRKPHSHLQTKCSLVVCEPKSPSTPANQLVSNG
ncbi:hypothetical protein AVEN_43335-1 [Araneus ventricosus]|uniref:Uncharacterized protein n=1 Tax=Araneus ventricosus TaxID=182803 RepID=A0A4Y2W102_ARAVE|nr:hypothetical protein AVEN_43335-1 [Araneus ventricosus]